MDRTLTLLAALLLAGCALGPPPETPEQTAQRHDLDCANAGFTKDSEIVPALPADPAAERPAGDAGPAAEQNRVADPQSRPVLSVAMVGSAITAPAADGAGSPPSSPPPR